MRYAAHERAKSRYVRVSTFDQKIDRQLVGIQLDKLYTDKASGKDVNRPQLEGMLGFVREGDTIIVHSMDRLARNFDDLRNMVQTLTRRKVRIEFMKENLTFAAPALRGVVPDRLFVKGDIDVKCSFDTADRSEFAAFLKVQKMQEDGMVAVMKRLHQNFASLIGYSKH